MPSAPRTRGRMGTPSRLRCCREVTEGLRCHPAHVPAGAEEVVEVATGGAAPIPSARIADLMREALALGEHTRGGWQQPGGSIKTMAHDYAARFHVEEEAAERQAARILSGETRSVTIWTADQWATFLGSHLALIAPELYTAHARFMERAR